MNKIALQLNDKTIIESLLEDSEFQIKIKDAICEGIAKKAIKLVNISPDIQEIASKISYTVKKEIEKQYFTKDSWERLVLDSPTISIIKKEIKEQIDNLIKDYIAEQVQQAINKYDVEIEKEIEFYKTNLHDWFDKYDVEYRFKKEVQDYIQKRFK